MNVFDALIFAEQAHRGQVDKLGEPYFGHVLRVVRNVAKDGEGATVLMAAALHDVIEDTPVTLGDLRDAGFSWDVVTAVEAVTRQSDELYDHYIVRLAKKPMASAIKRADLRDNLDPERFRHLDPQTQSRLRGRYEWALGILA